MSSTRLTASCGALFLLSLFSLAWADHGAPEPRLGGVHFCTDAASVQVTVQGEGEARRERLERRMSTEFLAGLREQPTASGGPHRSDAEAPCTDGYVVLGVYARYLDPETYLGFPDASYTYVTTTQVGAYAATLTPETSLPESVYTASASDIVQAPTDEALRRELSALASLQGEALSQTWVAANVVAPFRYALFGVLAVGLVLARAVVTVGLR